MVRQHWKPLTLLLLGTITWLSLQVPADAAPGLPGIDKLQHLMAYAALAFPVSIAKPRNLKLWLVALLFWSGVIELIQPLVERERDILDLMSNGFGLLVGNLVAGWLLKTNIIMVGRHFDNVERK